MMLNVLLKARYGVFFVDSLGTLYHHSCFDNLEVYINIRIILISKFYSSKIEKKNVLLFQIMIILKK